MRAMPCHLMFECAGVRLAMLSFSMSCYDMPPVHHALFLLLTPPAKPNVTHEPLESDSLAMPDSAFIPDLNTWILAGRLG